MELRLHLANLKPADRVGMTRKKREAVSRPTPTHQVDMAAFEQTVRRIEMAYRRGCRGEAIAAVGTLFDREPVLLDDDLNTLPFPELLATKLVRRGISTVRELTLAGAAKLEALGISKGELADARRILADAGFEFPA